MRHLVVVVLDSEGSNDWGMGDLADGLRVFIVELCD